MREKLGAIGNLNADGRPILGLDSRHLLEITLQSGPDAYLIPAHVWTPWFAALGSKSGFDSIEECYGDLTPHIFAVETGLSSDPPMNWRVSRLDRFTLVSNSDAHSPPMLGREASLFDTDLDYFAIRRALETGEGYGGTVEFFPEEGKYHLDGHRTCGVRLEPAETRQIEGRCPACGKPLTVGVMHRVEELADRPEETGRPGAPPFRNLVPLPEILGELHGVGAKSKAVEQSAARLLTRFGPELDLLEKVPLEDLERAGEPLLKEALTRLRAGQVRRDAGYDGEYGVIRLFEPEEIRARKVVAPLFGQMVPHREDAAGSAGFQPAKKLDGRLEAGAPSRVAAEQTEIGKIAPQPFPTLDPEQLAAAEHLEGPLLIVAGPGTGKTRTLTHRIAGLITRHGVPAEQCLAVTFSRRAAAEMDERLAALLSPEAPRPLVSTFHGLGLRILREQSAALGLDPGFRVATPAERNEIVREIFGLSPAKSDRLLEDIGRSRCQPDPEKDPELAARSSLYERALASRNLLDFDDLLLKPLALLGARPDLAEHYRRRFRWISIDEYQDIDPLQYALIRLLAPSVPGSPETANLCAIGDPDQSIYSFRGADVSFFLRFREDYPGARVVHLTRNYRSTRTVVEAGCQAIRPTSLVPDRRLTAVRPGPGEAVVIQTAASERAEAELVVHTLEQLLGGTSAFSFDSGRVGNGGDTAGLSFSDVAVLYRTEAQAAPLTEALSRSGIPFQKRSHRRLVEQPGIQALLEKLRLNPGMDGDIEPRLDQAVRDLTPAGTAEDDPVRTALLTAADLLRPFALRCRDDFDGFLSEIALGGEVDTWDPRAERVSLLTLHASKGLEFPVVFLLGCEDGILPLTWPGEPADIAEERRLFFVGLTRAGSRLFLFSSRQRNWRGQSLETRPSPFLEDLGPDIVEFRRPPDLGPRRPEQMRLL
jgi:uncharacterized protein (TIGR00375 family)